MMNILVESQKVEALKNPAEYMWGAALPPHSLENIGDKELRIIAVELKTNLLQSDSDFGFRYFYLPEEVLMPFAPNLDSQIRKDFAILLSRVGSVKSIGIDVAQFESLKVQCLTFIHSISNGQNQHLNNLYESIQILKPNDDDLKLLKGKIEGLKQSYEAGFLDNISRAIEASLVTDYLGQAEQLLNEGVPGQFDHVAAAVLIGAILEDALRRLCQRQNPPISPFNGKGNKTLTPLIDDLKKSDCLSELKVTQLRAWVEIRNYAAHGEFGKFKRQDVEQMLTGVQNFLADYL